MTTPTLATVRAALKLRFEGVPNIGRVNDYERYATQMSKLREIYIATIDNEKQLRGLHFRRATTNETFPGLNRWSIRHNWNARYFMALNDEVESEKTFDDLIEAIRDDFRLNPVIVSGLRQVSLITNEEESGVQVTESVPVLFADVLCHSARMTFATRILE